METLQSSPGIEIHGLKSRSDLNGRVGYLADPTTPPNEEGRCLIIIDQPITGEQIKLRVKVKNLKPTTVTPPKNDAKPYTTTGLLREGHGRLVDFALSIGRLESNNVGMFCVELYDDVKGIMAMDRSRREVTHMMNMMWTYWELPPGDAGYKGCDHGFNMFELITSWLQHNEKMHIQQCKRKDAKGNPMGDKRIDGKKGELLHPNFVKSIRHWGKERLPGYYWVMRDTPAGTLMYSEDTDQTYLVKGIVDKIGNVAMRASGKLPQLIYTTILPIFNYLTYSGQLQAFNTPIMVAKQANVDVNAIKQKVEKAVANNDVITCSAFALSGAWDTNTKKEIPMVCAACGKQRDKAKGVKLSRCGKCAGHSFSIVVLFHV